jgi:hypothetical protein
MKRYLLPTLLSLFAIVFYSCKKSNADSSKVLSTEEFVQYNINGTNYVYNMPADSVLANGTDSVENAQFPITNSVIANRIPGSINDFFKISYYDYNISQGSQQLVTLFYTPQIGLYPSPNTSSIPILLSITEYGNIGDYIAANFSALIVGPPPGNIQYNVICSFRVKRRI